MDRQNEARPDYVEVIPYRGHFIEANVYEQSTHFKATGEWGRSTIHSDDIVSKTKEGFGVIGQFDTKEQAVAETVAEGQKKIDEQIKLEAKAS
jgi:hypothetical protein